jgi:hypothetical protein
MYCAYGVMRTSKRVCVYVYTAQCCLHSELRLNDISYTNASMRWLHPPVHYASAYTNRLRKQQ